MTIETAELVRFHHTPTARPYMRPEVFASATLAAASRDVVPPVRR
ncbi:hypothetical protein [Kribbella catacumbae]|nr:hypothetical protein [Kribbella catacumbae]